MVFSTTLPSLLVTFISLSDLPCWNPYRAAISFISLFFPTPYTPSTFTLPPSLSIGIKVKASPLRLLAVFLRVCPFYHLFLSWCMNWLVSVLLFTTIFHWWFSQAIWQRRIMMNTNHECVGVIKYCIVILYLLELYIDKYPFHTWVKCHELGGRSSLFLSLNHSWGLGKRFLPFVLSPLHYFCTLFDLHVQTTSF